MSEQHLSLSAAAAAIEDAFGGRWGVWVSDTGWWWATRTSALTPAELAAGYLPYVQADNPDELAERVRAQERLTRPPMEGA